MFVRKKKYPSGHIGVIVAEKIRGKMKELFTAGVAETQEDLPPLLDKAREWMRSEQTRRHPVLDLFEEEHEDRMSEMKTAEQVLSCIDNILFNGADLILGRVFDLIGFDKVDDNTFRQLVLARLSYSASKAATVEYLKNHFGEDVSLSRIYRYLDRLSDGGHAHVQQISVEHTKKILGGHIGVLLYDVTTLYFEADYEDELRIPGFSKEGRHSNPQVILGLLVSLDGYPLAYCIHPGKKYEGHTMLPVVDRFVKEYNLGKDFVVVADSGLMNKDNVLELERLGYKYILGARIRNESAAVKKEILAHEKADKSMFVIDRGNSRRLLVGYAADRARKDARNRLKGISRLEKSYRSGNLTKSNVNKRGYNKFLSMEGDVKVKIDYDKIEEDARWDGLKGYLTNTTLSPNQICSSYHNLWNVERAFRISKSKIEIRPMFHFTHKRIEAHVCICFVALKVYKELERRLKLAGIALSVDKVLAMARTVTPLQVKLPQSKTTISRIMLLKRHNPIRILFNDDFWVTR